jgi:exonuclease SbcC
MILRRLKLNPFAGISDLEIAFDGALNVVLGPNEAGKSTVAHAVRMSLFTSTKYGKRQFDKDIKRFLPLTGGDTIRVELGVASGGSEYGLTKIWGRRPDSRLTLPEGGLLSDPEAVDLKLLALLGVKEGTFNSVLFTYQAGLSVTLKSLSEDRGPANDLATILRRAVFETDGVSVDLLQQAIVDEHEEYFSRWDPDLKRPEGGRGIENPFKRGVGKILAAYYERERLRRESDDALRYEEELDRLNGIISIASEEVAGLVSFVDANKDAVEDSRRRALLEAKKKGLDREERELRRISQEWPAIRGKIESLREKLEELKTKKKELGEELASAEELESIKKKLDIFERAKKKKSELEEAKKSLAGMKVIEKKDYGSLEDLESELSRLKTSLEAGKIALSITAKVPLKVDVTTDLEDEKTRELDAGDSVEFSAGGQIGVRHTDWTMKVKSGEMDFEQLKTKFEQVFENRERLLDRLDVAGLAEGKALYEKYWEQAKSVGRLQAAFEESLEGHEFDKLETAVAAADDRAARPSTTVAREQGRIQSTIAQVDLDIVSMGEQLRKWEKDYKSPDALLDLLIERRKELGELDEKLKGLKPVPDSFEDASTFIMEFEKKEMALGEKKAELTDFRIERAELEGGAPQESREEIEVRWKDAASNFESVRREDAIAEILETLSTIRASMDDQTLDPWVEELQRVIAPLTADRYTRVTLDGLDDPSASRSDGVEVPFQALSMGTKVGLGLALRLSMARYFLEGADGFLILDDPLVDMDPDRQRAAAQVIQNFATEKQVILVTCHPGHAELLGGNLIHMGVGGLGSA